MTDESLSNIGPVSNARGKKAAVRRSWPVRFLKKLLALCVATIITVLVCEMLVRIFAPQVLSVPMIDHMNGILTQAANISGRSSVPGSFDVVYHTNSQRLRESREVREHAPDGVKRVMFLGDSFVFGVGANDDETLVVRAGEALQRSLGTSVEVVNGGVGGTGTGMQVRWFEEYMQKFNPDVVVLVVFVNDIDDDRDQIAFTLDSTGKLIPTDSQTLAQRMSKVDGIRKKLRRIPAYDYLAAHSHLLNLIRFVASRKMAGATAAPGRPDESQFAQRQQYYRETGVPLFKAELKRLKELVEARGGKLALVWFPTRETIYPDSGPLADEARWQSPYLKDAMSQFSADQGVAYLDPTDAFVQRYQETGRELHYHISDRHATPEGYRLIGEQIAQMLLSKHLVGESGKSDKHP